MNWIQERDALIAQTLSFVQSVTGRNDDAGIAALLKPVRAAEPETLATSVTSAPPEPVKVAEPGLPVPAPRPIVPSDLQNEIRARIASFRAHQERFNREREQYFSATLARLRASLDELPPRSLDE